MMAKNSTYTGGKKAVGTPTLTRENYFQLIRTVRKQRKPPCGNMTAVTVMKGQNNE